MTLDYCFFCHDKKHFFVVKGHFCSFLVSNIYWLTSLSADSDISPFFINHTSEARIFFHYFIQHFSEARITFMSEILF